eukprot:CAMPEP_0174887774 /NCGR_PEP_ID=MMETSP0167-20121228/3002_1 /TAXON_ID=38298 /ORGANISM="Rhodella maculata, Strain CCMP736" /LENGTH=86 /DNA_ID=CAMNT_0016124405 /DNA_START=193 /DNA_END=453 /DNA_ORIENTATION=+
MIRYGLSLDVNGIWHKQQLSRDLQVINEEHLFHIDVSIVPELQRERASTYSRSRMGPSDAKPIQLFVERKGKYMVRAGKLVEEWVG